MTIKLNDRYEIGVEFLSDEALDRVAGGLNPQPLPPREAFSIRSLFSFAAHFAVGPRFLFR
ncbi:MAG: hypothetical protein H0V72_11865 [Bradyrhizobium sp.]|nr:hypothetical protein [Bradyrhizobium sp.]